MDYANTRELLESRLAELKSRASEIEEKLSDPGEKDFAENAVEMEDDEVRIGIGELTKKEIQEVEAALQRIHAGAYGKCTVCGKQIGKARLRLLPHTLSCFQCA